MRFRAFPERIGSRILSLERVLLKLLLERVDNFGTSEHFSGRKKRSLLAKTNRSGVVNFSRMQMNLF